MGRGSSKAGGSGGGTPGMLPKGLSKLEVAQMQARGTAAEQWYNESGQTYEQLKAMEDIYDISGSLKTVRSYSDIEKNPDLVRAKSILDGAPVGTVVNYDSGKQQVVMEKKSSGWTSIIIQQPFDNIAVVDNGTYKKYNDIQALNMFVKMQTNKRRNTLSGKALEAYKKYYNK